MWMPGKDTPPICPESLKGTGNLSAIGCVGPSCGHWVWAVNDLVGGCAEEVSVIVAMSALYGDAATELVTVCGHCLQYQTECDELDYGDAVIPRWVAWAMTRREGKHETVAGN
jgi:hypothetical protein